MSTIGQIALRDRVFQVKRACVIRRDGTWCVDIETEWEEFDGERWAPNLYHQGLQLPANNVESLQGQVTAWHLSSRPSYPHPELGVMYVFGHHAVRKCTLSFGKFDAGRIAIKWEGECDVFWEGEFSKSIPFQCECTASVADA